MLLHIIVLSLHGGMHAVLLLQYKYHWRQAVLLLQCNITGGMQYCYCTIYNITVGRQYGYCNAISLEACSIVTAYCIITAWRHAVLLLQCNITGGRQYCYCILYYHGMGAPIQCYNCNVLSLEVCMQYLMHVTVYCIGGTQYW